MDIIARDHFSQQFLKAGSEAEALSKKVATTGSKIGSAMKVGAAVGVAALVSITAASVELASKFEDSQKRLEAALKGAGSSFEDLKAPIAAADKSMEKLGFTNTQTADALANLTVATKNPTKSIQLLGVAADLARFKHIDLAEAATAVGKAMAGNLRPIKQLGIDLPVAASSALKVANATDKLKTAQDTYNFALATFEKSKTTANYNKMEAASKALGTAQENLNKTTGASNIILQTLSQRLGGQAQAAASTLAGKTEVLKARFEDMGIKLGTVLVPWLIKLVNGVSTATDWFQKHATATKILAGILGGLLVTAILRVTTAWVAANIAFIATPIGAVITAIVALIAGLVLLWKNWNTVWNAIKAHRGIAITVAAILGILLPFTLVIAGLLLLAKNWNTVWTAIQRGILTAERIIIEGCKAIVDVFLSMVQAILHGAAAAFGWIPGLGGKLKSARDAFDAFKNNVDSNFQAMINSTIAAQNRLGGLQGTINGLHGTTVTVKLVYDTTSVGGGGAAIGGRPVSGAAGGYLTGPGTKTSDSIPMWGSRGEFMMRAAAVDKYGLGFMENVNRLKFAQGGSINVIMPPNATIVGRLNSIESGLRPTQKAASSSAFGGVGGPATVGGNLGAWIMAALAVTGTSPSWAGAIQRRIMFESGGNPNAINLWDSNAMAGDPSRGLMQTIGSTFNAYHQPGTSGNIYDPVANIAAAINYIKSRYGSIFAIDPPVQGYRDGGVVDQTGLAYLHRGETVVPADSGGISARAIADAVADALSGATFRFDGDGLARLVTKKQTAYAVRGGRR